MRNLFNIWLKEARGKKTFRKQPKIYFIIFLLINLIAFSAYAKIENKQLVGQGRLNYFLLHIYDVKLYSANAEFSFDKPFELVLEYKRKLYGNKIAERSAVEIENLGFKDKLKLDSWLKQMQALFPDVDNGTNLTGAYFPGKPTVFYKDNQKIGAIEDPEFGKWFFGIWLNEKTSEPALRKALIGELS